MNYIHFCDDAGNILLYKPLEKNKPNSIGEGLIWCESDLFLFFYKKNEFFPFNTILQN